MLWIITTIAFGVVVMLLAGAAGLLYRALADEPPYPPLG